MQRTGYIIDRRTGEKVLFLWQQAKYCRYLKLRKSGKDGGHFTDEEDFLNEVDTNRLDELINGETICL